MFKTLIGKENYLFLQNDSAKELEVHNNNLCLVNDGFYLKYKEIEHKYLLIIFPNKSFIQKQFLPDNFDLKYRPAFNKYKEYLKDHILDGYVFLKDKVDHYYKTDTHINLKGNYVIYENFIDKINELFNLNITKKQIIIQDQICPNGLAILGKAIGDMTWKNNLGDQVLEDISDIFYYSDELKEIYTKYKLTSQSKIRILDKDLNDKTEEQINEYLHWHLISGFLLYQKNNLDTKTKVLIFYDSFLLHVIDLYLDIFDEVYFSKDVYNIDLINKINPDYVFEFRCERFLF